MPCSVADWFSSQFFEIRIKKRLFLLIPIILCLATCQYLINQLQNPKLNTVAALACAVAINIILLKGNIFALLLCATIQVSLIVACEFIPISFYALLSGFDIATITNNTISNAGFNLVGTGLFCIVIIFSKYIISNILRKNRYLTINENLTTLISPIVSIFVIYYILDSNQRFPFIDNMNSLQTILIYLGLLLMNIVVIVGDGNQKKRYQLRREIDVLQQLEVTNQIVIEQQDQYIEELKGFEHDYKKQMEGIKCLISSEKFPPEINMEIQGYTNDMLQNIKSTYLFSFIPTTSLRSILSQAQMHCSHNDISLTFDIQYADFYFVSFPDIYSLFENPIQNAIFSCEKIIKPSIEKFISIQILRKKNLIYIEIKNSKEHNIVLKGGTIQTTHEDYRNHGMGISNMKRVIKKYDGYINIDYSDFEFTVAMTLPIPQKSDVKNHITDKN